MAWNNDTLRKLGFEFVSGGRGEETSIDIPELKGLTGWEILDSVDNLRLIHYKGYPEPELYHLRGLIYDKDTKKIVAPSTGFIPTHTAEKLELKDGKVSFTTTDGTTHSYDASEVKLYYGFDHSMVRIYWAGGKARISTYRKIDATTNQWGDTMFYDNYRKLGGVDMKTLFPTEDAKKRCYFFQLVSPSYSQGSRYKGPGFIIYYGCTVDGAWTELKELPFPIMKNPDFKVRNSIVERKPIDIETANRFLTTGFEATADAEDPRLLPGEYVLLETKDTKMRVASPGYSFRNSFYGNEPPGYRLVYSMLDDAEGKWMLPQAVYEKKYPQLKPDRSENIIEVARIIFPQLNLTGYPEKHKQEREAVAAWLLQLQQTGRFNRMKFRSKRIPEIIRYAYGLAAGRERIVPTPASIKEKLDMAVRNEKGASFYQILQEYRSLTGR